MNQRSIFIVEDHPIFREALLALLHQNDGLEIIGTEGDPQQAIKRITDLKPEVVVTDLSMPQLRGQQLIETIKRRNPETKMIVLTMHKEESYVRSSLDAGADAYVLKDDTHQDLLVAINSVCNGKSYLSPGVCGNIVSGYLGSSDEFSDRDTSNKILTNRECQIIKLIAEGKTNSDIAAILSISSKTVEKHRSNMMNKLNLHKLAHLIKYAIDNGYL